MTRPTQVVALSLLPLLALEQPTPARMAPAVLRSIGTVSVDGPPIHMSLGPRRCDAAGNIFLVPLSASSQSGLSEADGALRLSADGRKRTSFTVATGLGIAGATKSRIVATALSPKGAFFVLAEIATAEAETKAASRQYIVAFNDRGQYQSKALLDPGQLVADGFAVFDSGEYLLWGRSQGRRRLVVMPASGPLRDVAIPSEPSGEESPRPRAAPPPVGIAEPAADGSMYVVSADDEGTVYELAPSGEVTNSFEIEAPRRGAAFHGLKISSRRLAAVYREDHAETGNTRYWIGVHELATGEPSAAYGPLPKSVACFQSNEGGADTVVVLGVNQGRMKLVTLSP